ncbi:hypothetical protein [Actinoplanes sp. CA-252034]|uniref:hypothetical protein n=1 Tax=Actinoplanes sp. CA-252034 TaxID=3239906 RepID=UPI003D977768
MQMLSVGSAGEERRTAVLVGLFSGLIGLGVAAFGFFFARSFYPRDWFPRSLFTEDPGGWEPADAGDTGIGSDPFGGSDSYDGSDPFGGGSGGADLIFVVGGVLFLVIGLLWALSFAVAIVRAFRAAAWLDGTRIHVRGAFRTRSIDLATAYVHQGAVTTRIGHRVVSTPTLEARDQATGERLSIPLASLGSGRLPPNELRALADAMSRGRGHSADDRDVLALAETLRAANL